MKVIPPKTIRKLMHYIANKVDPSFRSLWMKQASDYHKREISLAYKLLYEEIGNLVAGTGAKSILEYGCGDGRLSIEIKKINNNLEQYACDYVDGYFKNLSQHAPWLKLSQGDITQLKYSDKEFDVSVGVGVLMYIPSNKIRTALLELARVSQKLVCLVEFYPKFLSAEKTDKYRNMIGVDRYEYDYLELLRELNLKVIKQYEPKMFTDPLINTLDEMGYYVVLYKT